MKKLDKWVPHELTGNLKKKQIIVLKHHLILFCATRKNYFLIRIWWVVKIGFYTTIRDDQLSGLTEKQLQSTCQNQTCTKKGHGHCLVIWSTTAFWIPAIQLHMRSMCSKPMKCTENCNACSQHSSTERAQSLSTTVPDHTSHSQCFKSLTNWATKVCFICHIHLASYQLTITSSSISTFFAEKTLPQPAGGRRCFPRVRWILKHRLLCYKN